MLDPAQTDTDTPQLSFWGGFAFVACLVVFLSLMSIWEWLLLLPVVLVPGCLFIRFCLGFLAALADSFGCGSRRIKT